MLLAASVLMLVLHTMDLNRDEFAWRAATFLSASAAGLGVLVAVRELTNAW